MTDENLQSLIRAVGEKPNDEAPRLIAADRADELGLSLWADWLRSPFPFWSIIVSSNGNSYGDGYGFSHSYGYGNGNRLIDGHGDGYTFGFQNKAHDPTKNYAGDQSMPEVGKNQLLVLGHGWVVVGYVAEQLGPFHYRLQNAVNLVRRDQDSTWGEVAANKKGRNESVFHKLGDTITVGPLFVMSIPWVGDIPECR
jgi:hypothetical protein